MSDATLHSLFVAFGILVIVLLYRIEIAIRELHAELKVTKIDLIHEHRGVFKP